MSLSCLNVPLGSDVQLCVTSGAGCSQPPLAGFLSPGGAVAFTELGLPVRPFQQGFYLQGLSCDELALGTSQLG